VYVASIPARLKRVLIVDDEENIRHLLLVVLKKAGYEPTAVAGGAEALTMLEEDDFGVVISDIRMPGMSGRELLSALRAREDSSDSYVVMMSAYGGDEVAIECMKEGAYDYFNKPFKSDEVILLLRKIEEREQLRRDNRRLRLELDQQFHFDDIVGESAAMDSIFGTIKKIAPFKTTVLLTGESGTGKELLARAIHRHSDRSSRTLVAVNCGAIPENLLESELFGHARGAFTGAVRAKQGLFHEADGGTIFLDEVGELHLPLQVKLLRVLENEEVRRVGENKNETVDVRVIAATSRDLASLVRENAFREDLYYRLNVMHILVPPLRERPEDIPLLIESFMHRFNRKFSREVEALDGDAAEALSRYAWPGNVRELENAMERAMLLSEHHVLGIEDFPPPVSGRGGPLVGTPVDDADLSVKRRLAQLESELIVRALEQTGGNRTHACRLLEMSHRALLYKMKDYGIHIPSGRGS
jgi:two-component system response regulator AtoC